MKIETKFDPEQYVFYIDKLVKENGKVYYTQNNPLVSDGMWIDLTRAEIIPSQECIVLDYKIYGGYGYVDCFPFKWLYESKEDAEEYLKYNYITREEKLEIPTWKEFKNQEKQIKFFSYPCNYACYTDLINIGITEYYGMGGKEIFNKPLTRENYDEARDLCIKLFKGEEV